MTCKEVSQRIQSYVDGSISYKEMEPFISHIRSCESCMDELEMTFTIYNALQMLDGGRDHSYDLRQYLLDDLSRKERTVWVRKTRFWVFYGIVIAAEILLFSGILLRYLPFSDQGILSQVVELFRTLFRI